MEGRLLAVCALILLLGAFVPSEALSLLPVHPGVCPKRKPLTEDVCITAKFAVCASDGDCPDHQKCCSNGCANVCMDAKLVKPGLCPRLHLLHIQPWRRQCNHDYDCPKNLKCCWKGWRSLCVAPKKNEAVCPKALGLGLCVELCSSDADCTKTEKCCSNGCGHQCTEV